MSSFVIFLICVQACLIQAVFGCGSCGGASGAASGWSVPTYGVQNAWVETYSALPAALPASLPAALPLAAAPSSLILPEPYTSTGKGYTAAAGELLISGPTRMEGRVPVSGAAIFDGIVPAFGSVSIAGNCGYLYESPAYAAPAYAAPAYAAPALSPAVSIAAAPALSPAINFAAAPRLATGPAISPKNCGCN